MNWRTLCLLTLILGLGAVTAVSSRAGGAPAGERGPAGRGMTPLAGTPAVAVVVSPSAPAPEHLAAAELAQGLHRLYPRTRFLVGTKLPTAAPAIRVASPASDPSLRAALPGADLSRPESFTVKVVRTGGREAALVAGADPLGTLYAVYALLEKLGYGFYLSFDAVPPARTEPFSFAGWDLADAPLAAERIVFDWHNFLSGCSAWNLADWEKWTAQAQKMRFNTIMVHAYGNNPMFTFRFGGKTKPVGYLASTAKGRDWGTEHVNDVRRLWSAVDVFDKPVFGADAALVPEAQRVPAAQKLMRAVFASAARRGMHVCFALDVDTESSNPQELIRTLPESARFQASDDTWLAAPDTPEGYAYYRAQAEALLALYPQIDRLAIWIRTGGTPWTGLRLEQLPPRWQEEFRTITAANPDAAKLPQAAARFALGKVIAAFQRALRELKRDDIRLTAGSWGFSWLNTSDPFFPKGVPFLALDYGVLSNSSQLDTPERRAAVRKIAEHRPVVPILWAHHDDGAYVGRPFTPFESFQSKLADCGASSFGIIHWTTQPLDLYFRSLSEQVWQASKDRPLRATCEEMAARCFGPSLRARLGEYLYDWVTTAPIFGRETSDCFIDRPVTEETVAQVRAGRQRRAAMLAEVDTTKLDDACRKRLRYFARLDDFCLLFHQAEADYQRAAWLLKRGDVAGARQLLQSRPGGVPPEDVLIAYQEACALGGYTRGEQGVMLGLELNWYPFMVGLRQALRLEPVRVKFGPTSHADLAQGAGRLTFYAEPNAHLWRVQGTRETGAAEFSLPDSARLRLPPGMAAAHAAPARRSRATSAPGPVRPLPELAADEVCRTGIESERPITLRIRPMMADVQVQGLTPGRLLPGRYKLRLLMAEPNASGPGRRVFDVTAGSGGGERVRYTFTPIKAKYLRLVGHGSAENAWNSLWEVSTPALDRAAGATASAAAAGCEAACAIDGKPDTRWAALGDGAWLQIPLDPNTATDRLDVTWYLGDTRQYRFDLLASTDGRAWTPVAYRPEGDAAPVRARIDLFQRAGGDHRVLAVVLPVTVGENGTLEVTLTPVVGKALLCGAVLEPEGEPTTETQRGRAASKATGVQPQRAPRTRRERSEQQKAKSEERKLACALGVLGGNRVDPAD